ncbi:DUF6894 family protein [Methylobacterium nigriterrae]|uniref:DUF6894 family protein n=1 Tax=Methylobacterium nigriterrae TaxID=3127512 RepID=UPI003013A675
MPRFHLHVRTPTAVHRDEEGSSFASLEQAYLEACHAIPDIAADLRQSRLRRVGDDPFSYCFEITDTEGRVLMDVPFMEILDPGWYRRNAVLRSDHC